MCMKAIYLITLFLSMSGVLMAGNANESVETIASAGWETVTWTPEDGAYPETEISFDITEDGIIISSTGEKFITRVSGFLKIDINLGQTATPDSPVLAPSASRDLWVGQAKRVALSCSQKVVKELTVVLADEASIEADRVVTLSHETIEMQPGENIQLSASYTLEGVPQTGIVWSIDNTDVAEIDQTGLLVAAKEGTATVKATTTDGRNLYATCALTVVKKAAVLPGDVNNDGVVAVNDVVLAINAVLGQIPEGFVHEAADMSGDGQIMVNDVVLMINVILGVKPTASQVRQFLNSKQN